MILALCRAVSILLLCVVFVVSGAFILDVELFDITGKLIQKSIIYPGSTITHLDTRSLYNGQYIVRFTSNNKTVVKKVMITKD